jgi:hypothetical protein
MGLHISPSSHETVPEGPCGHGPELALVMFVWLPARRETGPPGENAAIFASWGTAVRNDRPPDLRVETGPHISPSSHETVPEGPCPHGPEVER